MNTNMIYNILISVIGIFLMCAGITDIIKKRVSRRFILALILLCLAALPFKKNYEIYDSMGGMIIGLCAICISIISHGHIGRGDGIVIAVIGIVLGFRESLTVICIASIIMCVLAIFVLMLRKGNRYTKLPFLPAVWVGYVMCALRIFI